ncbi:MULTISPECIES: TlpA family protein disulfide reductase [Chitinophagaceae]
MRVCKIIIAVVFLGLLPTIGNCQNKVVGKTMPNVMMRLTNGSVFNSSTLPKNKPIVLFYFSPDCEHCEHLTQTLFADRKALAGKNVVMVTFFGMPEVIAFAKKNQLENLPNVYIGSEGNRFVVPKFFGIEKFPFIALLDGNHKVLKTFSDKRKEADILKAIGK